MAGSIGGSTNKVPLGLSGVATSKEGNFYEVVSAAGYQKLTKEQLSNVKKAANGDGTARSSLQRDGITLKQTDSQQAALDRTTLAAAGADKFKGDKKSYKDFVAQQDSLGGNHKTFWQKTLVPAAAGALKRTGNAHGVVNVQGLDGKLFQVTRTDGKSPTKKDIELATKAAQGHEASQADLESRNLVVTAAPKDAASLLDPISGKAGAERTFKAGELLRGGSKV